MGSLNFQELLADKAVEPFVTILAPLWPAVAREGSAFGVEIVQNLAAGDVDAVARSARARCTEQEWTNFCHVTADAALLDCLKAVDRKDAFVKVMVALMSALPVVLGA